MDIQTSFTEKVTWSQDCNHRFLALLGNDGELDLALLDVKNRVRDLSLRKNNLILPIFGQRFSLAHLGEKFFGIKRGFNSLPHKGSPFSSRKGCPFPRRRQGEAVGFYRFPRANEGPACASLRQRARQLGQGRPRGQFSHPQTPL